MADQPFRLQHTPSDSDNARCRGCGKLIVWAFCHETGKNIPLDPSAPVYAVRGMGETGPMQAFRDPKAMVSHFSLCTHANQFSGSRKS